MAKKKIPMTPRNLAFEKSLDMAERWYNSRHTGYTFGSPEEDKLWNAFFDTAMLLNVQKIINAQLESSLSYVLKIPEEPSAQECKAYDRTVDILYDTVLTPMEQYRGFCKNTYRKQLNACKQESIKK